jgi:hypothetical protein
VNVGTFPLTRHFEYQRLTPAHNDDPPRRGRRASSRCHEATVPSCLKTAGCGYSPSAGDIEVELGPVYSPSA